MSVHKSQKSLKRDGILLLLFDVAVISVALARSKGSLFTSDALFSMMFELMVSVAVNIWWAMDAENWVKDAKLQKGIWFYVIFEVLMLIGVFILLMMSQTIIATALIYAYLVYSVVGIVLLVRYI